MVRTARIVRNVGRVTLWALVFAIAAMVFLPWRQTARGTGMVVALDPQKRVQPMLSPAKGLIKSVKEGLIEGAYVEKDEILIEMTPFAEDGLNLLNEEIAAIESQIEALGYSLTIADENANRQLDASEADRAEAEQKVNEAEQKRIQTEKELQSIEAEYIGIEFDYEAAKKASRNGLVSANELVSKRAKFEAAGKKLLQQEAKVEGAKRALEGEQEAFKSKLQAIDIKNEIARDKMNAARTKLDSKRKELIQAKTKRQEFSNLSIKAPHSGYIQQWSGLVNSQTVKEGTQLFVIVPEADELAVEMKVSGNDMPLIKEGDRVRMQFEGWPAVQFVGWPSVAIGTFGGKVTRVFPTDDGKGFFRVIVTPDSHFEREQGWPSDRYLRQGVRANGWVLLERVPLGYEIWRQLNGFPPVIADDEPKKDKGSKVKLPKG